MSDLELLFLVLVLLYGWECACWLRRGSLAFLTGFGRNWRAANPGTLLGNAHGGFIFANPLPPLGNLLVANPFPLALSPEGVVSLSSAKMFPWNEIRDVQTKGKKVFIKGELLCKATSGTFAEYLARLLRQLKKATAAERKTGIEKIFRDSFDLKAIEKSWSGFQKRDGKLRWTTNALFVYLFLAVPAVIWHFGLRFSWIGLLVGLFAVTISGAVVFQRAHKALYPDAEDERFTQFITVLLSPVTAIRARDILSRPLLETLHPLAVARVFCPAKQFQSLVGKVFREVRFSELSGNSPTKDAVLEAKRFSHSILRQELESFLKRNGTALEELLRPPLRTDESCVAYCPRCLAQFVKVEGACPDCGWNQLVAFKK